MRGFWISIVLLGLTACSRPAPAQPTPPDDVPPAAVPDAAPPPTPPAKPRGDGPIADGPATCRIRSVELESPELTLYRDGFEIGTNPTGDIEVELSEGRTEARLRVERFDVEVSADIDARQIQFHGSPTDTYGDVLQPLALRLVAVEANGLRGSFELPESIEGPRRFELTVPCNRAVYGWVERFSGPKEIERRFVRKGVRVGVRPQREAVPSLFLRNDGFMLAGILEYQGKDARVSLHFAGIHNGIPGARVVGWIPKSVFEPKPKRRQGVPGGVPGGVVGGTMGSGARSKTDVRSCASDMDLFLESRGDALLIGRVRKGAKVALFPHAEDDRYSRVAGIGWSLNHRNIHSPFTPKLGSELVVLRGAADCRVVEQW